MPEPFNHPKTVADFAAELKVAIAHASEHGDSTEQLSEFQSILAEMENTPARVVVEAAPAPTGPAQPPNAAVSAPIGTPGGVQVGRAIGPVPKMVAPPHTPIVHHQAPPEAPLAQMAQVPVVSEPVVAYPHDANKPVIKEGVEAGPKTMPIPPVDEPIFEHKEMPESAPLFAADDLAKYDGDKDEAKSKDFEHDKEDDIGQDWPKGKGKDKK